MRTVTSKHFVMGVVAGVGLVWAYHHWAKPLPGAKPTP